MPSVSIAGQLEDALTEASIARKGDRLKGLFVGSDSGTWKYLPAVSLDAIKRADWYASVGMSSKNGWRNLSV